MKDVIGFGALNVDLIYALPHSDFYPLRRELHLIPNSENIVAADEFSAVIRKLAAKGYQATRVGGGSAANTVFALSKMGFRTGYISKVGQDPDGTFLLLGLSKVDCSRVCYGAQTGRCAVLVDEDSGERTILVLPAANDELTYNEVNLGYLRQTRFLHLTSFVGNGPFEVQKRLAEELGPEVRISFDPGEFYSRRGIKELEPIISNSFIVFATERELKLMLGKSWYRAAELLLQYGVEIVVCKMGRAGSAIFTPDYSFEVMGEKVKVVDSVGAGDVYAAGFLAGLLLDLPVTTAALLASRAATQSVTGRGRRAYPNRNLLREFGRRRDV